MADKKTKPVGAVVFVLILFPVLWIAGVIWFFCGEPAADKFMTSLDFIDEYFDIPTEA